jgi:xanthine dehydrogenase accessory factor
VLNRVTTPIGLPELPGKDPATIAVGVAATLLLAFGREPAAAASHTEPEPIDERR